MWEAPSVVVHCGVSYTWGESFVDDDCLQPFPFPGNGSTCLGTSYICRGGHCKSKTVLIISINLCTQLHRQCAALIGGLPVRARRISAEENIVNDRV